MQFLSHFIINSEKWRKKDPTRDLTQNPKKEGIQILCRQSTFKTVQKLDVLITQTVDFHC